MFRLPLTSMGKTRVPFDGEPMEEYALERYIRLKKNIKEFAAIEKDDSYDYRSYGRCTLGA